MREVLTCFGCTPEKLANNMLSLVCLCPAIVKTPDQSEKETRITEWNKIKNIWDFYLGHKIEYLYIMKDCSKYDQLTHVTLSYVFILF